MTGEAAEPAQARRAGRPRPVASGRIKRASRARTYDTVTGCFLQADPRGLISSPNSYAYAGQNPIDFIDPTGEVVPLILAVLVIGGALGGAGYSFYDASDHPERYGGGAFSSKDLPTPGAAQSSGRALGPAARW